MPCPFQFINRTLKKGHATKDLIVNSWNVSYLDQSQGTKLISSIKDMFVFIIHNKVVCVFVCSLKSLKRIN